MQNPALEKWSRAALEVSQPLDRLPLPLHALSSEAIEVARFVERHWASERDADGKLLRLGLELVARGGQLGAEVCAEILELQQALLEAHSAYLLSIASQPEAPIRRAEYVLSELQAVLAYWFDDAADNAADDQEDARVALLRARHQRAFSHDARAAALDDYGTFAALHRETLHGLGGFDGALIDEAPKLAQALREQSAHKLAGASQAAQKAALALRNRLATLLYERMLRVRAAARFVFRSDAETLRKVTSSYQRKRRAKLRKSRESVAAQEPVG